MTEPALMRAVGDLTRALVRLSDADLGRPWAWHEYDEEGLRFALLMAEQRLRELAVRSATPKTEARRILGRYHVAYRELTGLLAGVRDDELDRAPAEGEWPLREVLAHVLVAEAGFRIVIAHAVAERRAGRPAVAMTAEERRQKRERELEESDGDLQAVSEIVARSHVRVLRELMDIADDELETPVTFWEDTAYPVRFRLHRFEEHLRQHMVQLEKTLAAIGHPPTEAERLVRLVHRALGDAESHDADDATRGRTAAAIDELTRSIAR